MIVGLVAALVSACGRGAAAPQGADDSLGLLIIAPEERAAMAEIAGDSLTGGSISLADYQGQLVVLNAFASWCTPCQQELPVLAVGEEKYPQVQFVGLDVQDNDEAALGFLAAKDATYPVIKDPAGELLAKFTINPANGLPVTFFIDEQGKVAGRILGKVTAASLAAAIKSLT